MWDASATGASGHIHSIKSRLAKNPALRRSPIRKNQDEKPYAILLALLLKAHAAFLKLRALRQKAAKFREN